MAKIKGKKPKYTKSQLTAMLKNASIWRTQLRTEAERMTGLSSVADFHRVVEACKKILDSM